MWVLRQGFRKLLLIAGFWLLVAGSSFSQSTGDYRTNGAVDFISSTNWERYNAGWGPAAVAPSSADGVITIQDGHTATVTSAVTLDQFVVNSTGILQINAGQTLTVNNAAGTDLDVNGTINNSGIISQTGTIVFNAASVYNHIQDGVSIPDATWNVASNCNITGVILNAGPAVGLAGKTFGNFTWNCPAQTTNYYMASDFIVAGNFRVSGTGTPDHINHSLRMSNSGTGYSITVAGDFIIDNDASFKMNNSNGSCVLNIGGNFSLNSGYFTIVTGTVNSTLNITGNVIISGGNLVMKEDAVATVGTLNVSGNFTQSGGIITLLNTPPGTGSINFNGTIPQTFSKTGGTISNVINFTVNNGAILDLGTGIIDGSSGSFTLNAGAGIITAHAQGLSSTPGTGSIQVSGAKTFNSGADYTYNGSAAQVTGNAISTARNFTISNSSGLTLTNSVTVNGSLALAQGILTTGGNIMHLANGATGSLSYGASGFINGNFERAINTTSTNYYFPVGATQRQMAKFNFANLTNGSLRVSYQASDPAGNGLSLYDTDSQVIRYEFNNGYWTALGQNGLVSNNYSLTLDAAGFNNPDNINSSTRIIKRTGVPGGWTINGTPGTVAGNILERLNCSDINNGVGTQFGAGTGNCFSFTGQPGSITRCVGDNASFSTSVSGALGAVTYQWFKDGNSLSDGGNISGATTNSLSISNLAVSDEASYYCRVTDDCSSQSSQSAFLTIPRPAAALGYGFQKAIAIDHTKVIGGSDLMNFPVLIKISGSPELETVPNGGHVENANGYDIIFTDANYNKLDHQVESYTSTNGSLIAWVRVPVLSASANTTILMLYGNPQIIADPSVKAVWKSSYQAVWHMGDNPAGAPPQLIDAAQSNNGTSVGGMVLGDLVPGNTGNAIHFDGVNDHFDVGMGISPAGRFTEEFWIKVGNQTDAGFHGVLGFEPPGGDVQRPPSIYIVNQNKIHAGFGDNTDWCFWQTPGIVLNNNDVLWNHLVVTFDGTNYKLYINGSEVHSTNIWAGRIPYNTPLQNIGRVDNYFLGTLDEIRVLSEALTPGWITTEFNNQGSPDAFYTIGGENPCSVFEFDDLCSGSPITYSVPNTSGHTYTWSVVGGTPSSTSGNNITVTWDVAGPWSIQLSESDGTCTGNSIIYNVIATAQPIGPVLNTKIPDLAEVCVGQLVSASFTAGSGGIGCTDSFQYRFDGVGWLTYIGGTDLNTTGHTLVEIQGRRSGCTGAGCTGTAWVTLATWNVNPQPVGPILNVKSPDLATVCDGQQVSATFTVGSGGVGCTDAFEYRFDGGSWLTYTEGTNLNTTGHTLVEIQGRRSGCTAGAGCTGTAWVTLATWNVIPQPVGPTLNVKIPAFPAVCEGQLVSATFTAGSGGVGCTDAFQYRFDGESWLSYTGGTNLNTTGHTLIEIQGQRSGCTGSTGCTGTVWVTLASWIVNPNPIPVISGSNNVCPGAAGIIYSTPFIAGHTYSWSIVGADSYTGENTNILTVTWSNTCGTGSVSVTETITATGCTLTTPDYSVSRTDTQVPVWATAAGNLDRTLQCSDAAGIAAAQALFPAATDNCDADVSNIIKVSGGFVVGSCAEAGTYTNTWTVTDACGNASAVYTQVITIIDTQAPVWTTAAGNLDRTVQCSDAAGIAAAQALFPAATDNCDADVSNIIKVSGGFVVGSCAEEVTYTNTWTVTDACGNASAVYTQVITIIDTQAPVWTTAAGNLDRTVQCSDAAGIAAAQALFPAATDNCDADVSNIIKVSGGFVVGLCAEAGTYTNTWTVTDACGNNSTVYTQVITIIDTQAPVWTTAAGNLDRTLQCSDAAGIAAAQALFPAATDNCDADVSNIIKVSGGFVVGLCAEAGTYTNTWTVTDACGNASAVYTQVITIIDTQAPVWTTAAGNLDRTVQCSDAAGIAAAQALFPAATDNCDADVSNIIKVSGGFVVGSCAEEVTYTNTWTVTDACGNASAVYTQVITIIDTQAPVWTTAAGNLDKTLQCSDAAGIAAAQALFPAATDNCDADVSNIVKISGFFIPDGNPREGTYTNTWTVTDNCGNVSAIFTQVISIIDNTSPGIVCPVNVTIDCEDDSTPAGTGTATATDNCSPALNIAITFSDVSTYSADPASLLHYNYIITRTWRATDEAGNFSECIQIITVHDITSPVITCPVDVTIDCEDDNTPTGTGTASATDNCAPVLNIVITFIDVSTYSADPVSLLHYNYTITRTWRATDVAGNFSECIQIITVHDITNPVITCPVDVTIDCEDDNTPTGTGTATATDNCALVLNIAITFSDVSTYSADPASLLHYNYTITRTWRATDVAGNFSECIQTIIVHDITNPVITCPVDVTIDCEDDNTPTGTGTATVTDNCAPVLNIAITFSDVSTYSADPANLLHYNYTITRTWRATDVAGNFSECIQIITVHDITSPVITCPVDVTIDCEDDNTPAGTGTATATDNCTPVLNIVITFSDVSTYSADPASLLHYNYTITRTWRATDVAGNFSECIQIITVHDITSPVITCPVDVTIDCEDDNTPTGTGTASATDNCAPVLNIVITFIDVSTYSADPVSLLHYNYTITRTWRATDVAGNFSECIQIITVHDITNPVITCPVDVTIDCEDDNTPTGTGTATATDNCALVLNIAITFSDVSTYSADPASLLHYNYIITRTWRATDVAGNFSECIQIITVHDITNPVITCPVDVTIDCEDDNTPTGTGTATVTDNCAPVLNIAITFSDVSTYSADPANLLHYNYTITRTWRATDVAGNFSECIQIITVHDITSPVITCPVDVTIDCEDDNTPAGTGTATATDNCTPVLNIVITFSDVSTYSADPASLLHYNYTITRTWRATDVAGNFSECIQIITVHDITSPVITCPVDVTIDCEDDNTPAGTGTATATDNCSPVLNIAITFSDVSTYSADPANLLHYNYTITRTWRATDVAGNFSECIQIITVHDITSPVITCPVDVTIDCEDDNTPTGTGTATVTDNCAPALNITITFSDVSTYSADPASLLHYNYTITRTWRATDVAGNFSECIQIITVHDITSPVITCPVDVTIDCEDDNTPTGTGTATVTDNCALVLNIAITFSDVSTYSADPASLLHYNYIITRTWRATDVAGNFSECTQIITVHDITNPVITCPVDVTIDCEDDNTPTGTGTATVTDNCAPVLNIVITFIDVSTYSADPVSLLHYNYTITRTWRATDVAGNFSECIQIITVHDITNPVITCPVDVTIDCEDDNTPTGTGTATATDNCALVLNIAITFSDVSTYSADPASLLHYNYTITRTWRATDVAGNFSECIQTIIVHDITSPVITCPVDVTIDCEDDNTPTGTGTATVTDNCAPVLNIAITFSDVSTYDADPASLLHYNYTITRTWRATDVAGNFSECTQVVTVHDITNPTFSVPPAITICRASDCSYDIGTSVTGDVTNESDNCTPGSLLNATYSDDLTGLVDCNNFGYVLRTWSLTDISGNTTTQVQTIWIEPTPTVTVVNNAPVICNEGNVNLVINSPTISITPANLSYVIAVTSSDPLNLGGSASTGFTLVKLDLPFTLTGTLTNSSDSPIIVTYTITPELNDCADGPVQITTVTVDPTPQVIPTTLAQTICNDGTTNVTLGSPSTFTSGVITFNYTVVATGGVTGFTTPVTGLPRDYVIADVLHNPTDAPQTVTYTIVPVSPTGCASGPVKIVVITVDPTPQVMPTTLAQTICNDGTTNVTLGSPSTFTSGVITFDYTVVATGGVTGFTTPVTGLPRDYVIADVLHNPTDAPQTVTYTIVPVSPTGCASGPVKIVVITVNPTPQVIPTTLAQTICNDGTTNVPLGSPSTFTSGVITFNYTVVATGGVTGFTTPVTGLPRDYVIADVLHNPTDAPQTVTYTVVPISPTGCAAGPTKIIVITIDPTPQVVPSTLALNICNDGTTSIVLTSPSTFSSGVITFNYTVVATGGVTGFTTPVTGLPRDYVIADVLHNPTDAPQTVTYTIVPVSSGGCPPGPVKIVIVTVEPTPQVEPGTLAQTICNDGNTNILLHSPSTFTNGVITFNYTVVATGGVTGFTTPVTGLPNDHIISDILHNPTDAPQTVTYTIVPISPECSSADPIKIVVVTVNPTPQVIPNTLSQTICNDASTNVTLGSPSTFTSGVITFNYTVVATGGVTGFITPVTGIPRDYVIADILHNPTDAPQTVTYTIIPISPTGCPDGPAKVVTITVNPTPQVVPGTLLQTICNDSPTNVILGSPSTFSDGVITFNYTVVATGGVTGFTTPVTGLPRDYVIADVLHNPTDAPQTVTYTIVPVSPTGCASGPVKIVVITVDPTPQVMPTTLAQTICNDGTTNVTLGSPSTFTSGVITFDYTVVATGGVTGFTTPVTGLLRDYVIADVLHNPTDAPQTVTYTIVPVSPTGCASGPVKIVVITVNPTPQVIPTTLAQTICNDGTTNVPLGSPSTFTSGVITFNYTVVATGGVTGFTTPVTGLPKDYVIADVLHNPTDAPQTVTYTVVPISPTGCAAGPTKIIVITVNPTPQVIPTTLAQTICNDGTTNVTLGSPSTFTSGVITFNYTVVATGGVTGFTTPVTGLPRDYVIADVLHNPTDAPQTVTYTIVPVSPTGCASGPVKIVVITVNPTPQVIPTTLAQTICNDGTTNVILGSPSTFTSGVITFNYTVVATGGVTGFTTPVTGLPRDYVIADVLHNPTDAPQTVTYTVVPISPTGCAAGPTKIIVITINPTPQVVADPMAQTLCNDGTTSVSLGSPSTFSNGVITFNYTVVATGGVTGFTTPVTGLPKDHVISDILHNPTDAPQTATYTIIPISPSGCAPGPGKIVIIYINPTPRIFPIPLNTIQCDSLTTNILLQSPSTFTSGLITFNYAVTTTGAVSGFSTPVIGLSNNQIVADNLINETDHFQIVTYNVVPVSPTGCTNGPSQNITVTVNPTPRIVPNNIYPAICYVGTPQAPVNTQIVLNSPTVMTSGAIRFDYTVSITGGPGVIIGNTAPATNLQPGYTINFTYQNNSDTIQSVYYSLIPKVDNAICVPGRMVVSEIKVHAQPLQSIVVTEPLTCSGGAGLAALRAVISKGANPYQVAWDGPVGYHKDDSLEIANLSSGKYVIKVTDNLGCNRKDSINIVPVTALPYISAEVIPPGNYNISCIGSTDGRILVSVTGGITPPYNYWVVRNDVDTLYSGIFTNNLNLSNPSTYNYYNNLGAGSYTLIIRDVNGCVNLNRIVFKVPPPMVAEINKSQFAGGFSISCKGYNDGSAWVQTISGGRGGYTYNWYTLDGNIPGPVNTNRIDNVIAGTYFLEIRDVLNCLQVVSTVVTEPDGMQLSGSQLSLSPDGHFNVSCTGGNDGFITMTISGGSGNYNFSWTGPAGYTASTKDISALKAGVYTCSVTDLNGCVLTPQPTFTLTEPSALVIGQPVISTSTDGAYNINCYGANTGWINITVSGGSTGTYYYSWSTTNGSGIINGLEDQVSLTAGTYHLVVTDLNNCVSARDITLTQPPVYITQLTPTNITCKSPGFNNGSILLTVSGGVAPYSYLWSNGAVTKDLNGLEAGNYIVTVTDFNGCIKEDSVRIDLPPTLNYTKELSGYNGFNISCNGLANGFIHVDPTTGSAPFIYLWTGPDGFTSSTKNISDLRAGQYQLLIVDSNECKALETFELTEPGELGMTISVPASIAGEFNINCAGDITGYIDIEPVNQVISADYLWADGIFGKMRTNLPAGSYSVIITDANNCHASETITLTEPDSMKLSFEITAPFCSDKPDGRIGTIVSGGVRGAEYLYLWSDNSTGRNLLNIPEGFYKVTVTDMNGCTITDSVRVEPINETCLIIPNAISPNGDLINDVWNIGLIELYPLMEIKIFNRWGESIWKSEKGYPLPWDGTSNGSPLPIDSYHYIIDLHNGSKPLVGNVTIVK